MATGMSPAAWRSRPSARVRRSRSPSPTSATSSRSTSKSADLPAILDVSCSSGRKPLQSNPHAPPHVVPKQLRRFVLGAEPKRPQLPIDELQLVNLLLGERSAIEDEHQQIVPRPMRCHPVHNKHTADRQLQPEFLSHLTPYRLPGRLVGFGHPAGQIPIRLVEGINKEQPSRRIPQDDISADPLASLLGVAFRQVLPGRGRLLKRWHQDSYLLLPASSLAVRIKLRPLRQPRPAGKRLAQIGQKLTHYPYRAVGFKHASKALKLLDHQEGAERLGAADDLIAFGAGPIQLALRYQQVCEHELSKGSAPGTLARPQGHNALGLPLCRSQVTELTQAARRFAGERRLVKAAHPGRQCSPALATEYLLGLYQHLHAGRCLSLSSQPPRLHRQKPRGQLRVVGPSAESLLPVSGKGHRLLWLSQVMRQMAQARQRLRAKLPVATERRQFQRPVKVPSGEAIVSSVMGHPARHVGKTRRSTKQLRPTLIHTGSE